MELSPEEEAERQEIIGMSDKARSKALVAVLRSEGELASLATPRGFLLTGPPGTGKSLLMDIFFASLPIPHKVRFHYHQYVVPIVNPTIFTDGQINCVSVSYYRSIPKVRCNFRFLFERRSADDGIF